MESVKNVEDIIKWYKETNILMHNVNQLPDQISFEKYMILQSIYDNQVITVTGIARDTQTTNSAASRKISELSKLGLIDKRYADSDDQRVVHLVLTDKGNMVYQEVTDFCNNQLADLIATA